MYYDERRRDKPGDYFPLPKVIFHLGLNAGEIAVLAYLMYCENRKNHQCHPSYKTIGRACRISVNTVKKHVESLVKKGFICTEPTKINTKDGKTHNGSLLYTILPTKTMLQEYNLEQLRKAQIKMDYEKLYGGKNEAVNL